MFEAHYNKRRRQMSLTLMSVIMVLLIAGLTGGTLWVVRRLHGQLAHAEAARAVLKEGEAIVSYLAKQRAVISSRETEGHWAGFSELVQSLHTVQSGLQYVSIVKGDVTVFHEQLGVQELSQPPAIGPVIPSNDTVRLTRRLLQVGSETMPVVVFSVPVEAEDGSSAIVEVALRVDAVSREERAAMTAIAYTFRLSLTAVLVAFGVCALVVVWTFRREARREKMRREEEHLAFSGVLANGIAHDFRNPMSAMRLDVQMLDREAGKPDARAGKMQQLASRIRGTLDRMDTVFQEFFSLSRPTEENVELVSLQEVTEDCVGMLAPRLEQAGIVVDREAPDAPIRVSVFSGALRRAVTNVLINAEHFAGSGGQISVQISSDRHHANLDIMDSGPGIKKSERKRIFDMFVSSRPGGTGLGLFLARTAVERCGGTILAMDHEGGAHIRIRLPLVTEKDSES